MPNTLTLSVGHCIKDSCNKLEIYDTTPANNGENNGWGTEENPGVIKSQVSSATITIKSSTGAIDELIDVTETIQTSNADAAPLLLTTYLGNIEDGLVTITFTVASGQQIYSTVYRFFNICNVKCCVDKLWAEAVKGGDCGCPCSNSKMKKAMEAQGLLGALKSMTSCNNFGRNAPNVLGQLQTICKLSKCNCK